MLGRRRKSSRDDGCVQEARGPTSDVENEKEQTEQTR